MTFFINLLNRGLLGIAATEASGDLAKALLWATGAILCILEGYFIGAFSPAIYFSKKLYGSDVRKSGSGNAGSTNMLRTHGKKAGLITALGDLSKGIIVCVIGYICLGYDGASIAGLFAVVGHIAPVYYHFKGGKGVMVAAAALLMIDPIVFAISIALFAAIVFMTKFVSLGSVMAAVIYPLILARIGGHPGFIQIISCLLSSGLIIFMHRGNIKRLMNGEENKISLGKKDKKADTEDVVGTLKTDDAEEESADEQSEAAPSSAKKKPQPKSKKNQKKMKKGKK